VPPSPERTTDSGGQLPNTSAFNWAAPLASGFGVISLGTGIHWTRRRSS
jgi:LPXTG-motif cell wall-anchored protein